MSTVVPFGLRIITNAATNVNAQGHSSGFPYKQEQIVFAYMRAVCLYIMFVTP